MAVKIGLLVLSCQRMLSSTLVFLKVQSVPGTVGYLNSGNKFLQLSSTIPLTITTTGCS